MFRMFEREVAIELRELDVIAAANEHQRRQLEHRFGFPFDVIKEVWEKSITIEGANIAGAIRELQRTENGKCQ